MLADDSMHREFGLHLGKVVSPVDPEKRGRAQIRIPGLLEPWVWAEVAMLGSPYNRGHFVALKTDTDIIVGFLEGDLRLPVVLGSITPPATSAGIRASMSPEEVPRVLTIENDDWIFSLGDTSTPSPVATIRSRGSPQVSVSLDTTSKTVEISGPVSVNIKSDGLVRIDAAVIQLGTRTVLPVGGPI